MDFSSESHRNSLIKNVRNFISRVSIFVIIFISIQHPVRLLYSLTFKLSLLKGTSSRALCVIHRRIQLAFVYTGNLCLSYKNNEICEKTNFARAFMNEYLNQSDDLSRVIKFVKKIVIRFRDFSVIIKLKKNLQLCFLFMKKLRKK